MNNPLVSVFLSSYNHEEYIGEAIESILNQTFSDFELIISDDCSTDNSWDVINRYKDSRIIKIRNEHNQVSNLTQSKINSFRGKYVAIHSSDDVWEREKLERQVAFLENNPEYAACFTGVEYIDEESKNYILPDGHPYKNVFKVENRSREEWLHYFFFRGNCLCHPSILIHRASYQKYNLLGNRMGLKQLPDFIIWIRLCLHENIFVLPEKLMKFRLRRTGQGNTSSDRPETHIRSQYEYYKVMETYSQITDEKEFLKIFPEAAKYVVGGDINIKFALAHMLLEGGSHSGWLLGLDLIFRELNMDVSRKQLLELYNFDVKSFGELVAKTDVFNENRYFRFLNSQLFIDIGDGSGIDGSNVINQRVYISGDNNFYVVFDTSDYEQVVELRYDPTDTYISMKLDRVKIDGEDVMCQPCNTSHRDGEKEIFYTNDPQYMIYIKSKNIGKIEIWGHVYALGNEAISTACSELHRELAEIKGSRGYRLLKKLRAIKHKIL